MTEQNEVTHEQRLSEADLYREREQRKQAKMAQKPKSYEEAQAAAEKKEKGARFVIRGSKVVKIKGGYSSFVGLVKDHKELIKKHKIQTEV